MIYGYKLHNLTHRNHSTRVAPEQLQHTDKTDSFTFTFSGFQETTAGLLPYESDSDKFYQQHQTKTSKSSIYLLGRWKCRDQWKHRYQWNARGQWQVYTMRLCRFNRKFKVGRFWKQYSSLWISGKENVSLLVLISLSLIDICSFFLKHWIDATYRFRCEFIVFVVNFVLIALLYFSSW